MSADWVLRFMRMNVLIANQQTAPTAVGRLVQWVESMGSGLAVHLSNAYTLTCVQGSQQVAKALTEDLSFPDGAPLAKLMHLWEPRISQVYGPQLMRDTLANRETRTLRHFLYGGSQDTNDALAAHIQQAFPDAHLVGRLSPPFRAPTAEDRNVAIQAFTESHAQIIWVGLGTPRQDIECHELSRLYPGVFIAVGAAFDFLPGIKRDCPSWIRRIGMQWLHRLVSEPKRLWRRYLVGNAVFLWLAARQGWRRPTRQSLDNWLAEQR